MNSYRNFKTKSFKSATETDISVLLSKFGLDHKYIQSTLGPVPYLKLYIYVQINIRRYKDIALGNISWNKCNRPIIKNCLTVTPQ